MDETNTAEPTQGAEPVDQSSETPPTSNGEKLLPQSEVNRLVANARREGYERAQKKPTAAPVATAPSPTPAQAPPAAPADSVLLARIEEMELRGKFDRAAIKAGIDDEAADDWFDLFKAQRPPDPAAWIADKQRKFGIGRSSTTTQPAIENNKQAPAQTTAPAQAPKPTTNITDRGPAAAGDALDAEAIYDSRPLESTADDFERLALKHGRAKAHEMARDRILAYLRGVKLVPEHRRQR